ncbi:hypothetical protein CRV15_32875 (plasmid) [Streptomyces clavuligerus]|uniref:Uncharacterized protein n=1 Tax=Streptomyces clavuligerus TaxID=1901 RepID=B5GMG4_STRCL|nr:hypothetical protein D1794_32175 [Streptomyces clavuligerus]EDY47510.1 hypothetical protein SSCG_00538 [Streptomyces clavuligerus]EFG04471.1 Hypothetical protein SCLAV_p0984 [Streptomyces clavuligerus]QCS10352.1 hypothetical protein CRV15_32875 [Streptomyces clavuligerus]QPJ97603.1 hypothetical protein GE265_31595 [Streptomyces clavuligerus]
MRRLCRHRTPVPGETDDTFAGPRRTVRGPAVADSGPASGARLRSTLFARSLSANGMLRPDGRVSGTVPLPDCPAGANPAASADG